MKAYSYETLTCDIIHFSFLYMSHSYQEKKKSNSVVNEKVERRSVGKQTGARIINQIIIDSKTTMNNEKKGRRHVNLKAVSSGVLAR